MMEPKKGFKLDDIRVGKGDVKLPKQSNRKARKSTAILKEPFLKATPMSLLQQVHKLGGSATLAVFIAIKQACDVQRESTIRFTMGVTDGFEVGDGGRAAALKRLQNAGIIKVEPREGATSLVTLLVGRKKEDST